MSSLDLEVVQRSAVCDSDDEAHVAEGCAAALSCAVLFCGSCSEESSEKQFVRDGSTRPAANLRAGDKGRWHPRCRSALRQVGAAVSALDLEVVQRSAVCDSDDEAHGADGCAAALSAPCSSAGAAQRRAAKSSSFEMARLVLLKT